MQHPRAYELADRIREFVDQHGDKSLEPLLREYSPVDIAIALRELDEEHRNAVFERLSLEEAAAVLEEADDETSAEVLDSMDDRAMADIIDAMPPDAGADAIALLDEEDAERVLELMPDEESEELEELLKYDPDTAGGIMTPEFVSVPENVTAADVLTVLRSGVVEPESISYVYVTDAQDRLAGVLDLRELVTADPSARIPDFCVKDVISVTPDVDQEEVARLCNEYDLMALPVVDEEGHVLGTVTVDDVMDVVHEEATEDIAMLGGTQAQDLLRKSSLGVARVRLPWLIPLILGSMGSATIIRFFEVTLKEAIALVAFIPVINATAGNSGLQSSTITVRSLALGLAQALGIRRLLARDLATGAMMGLACGGVVGGVVSLWLGDPCVGLIVGLSLCCAIVWSTTIGTLIPHIFYWLHLDPALASGPLVTTLNDIFALLIYFGIATAFLVAGGNGVGS
ncbi:MAG: magnesium transporter [Armatimonadota bacterium]